MAARTKYGQVACDRCRTDPPCVQVQITVDGKAERSEDLCMNCFERYLAAREAARESR